MVLIGQTMRFDCIQSKNLVSYGWCRYGFLGKKVKDLFGPKFGPVLSGLVGLRQPRDHGTPYSLTEEFVSVYRIHSLLPDKILLRDVKSATSEDKCPPIQEEYVFLLMNAVMYTLLQMEVIFI